MNVANLYAAEYEKPTHRPNVKNIKSSEAKLKNFNSLLKQNNVVLNAQLKPNGNGTYSVSKLELAKENPLGHSGETVPITDDKGVEGYTVSSEGKSLNDALLNMIECYKGQALYCSRNGSTPIFSVPNYDIL